MATDDVAAARAAYVAQDAERRGLTGPIDRPDRSVSRALGYMFGPGDLVVDRVTGVIGEVIHATREDVIAATPHA